MLGGIVHGGRATLTIGAGAAAIRVIVGIATGAMAGFCGGLVDEALMRIAELRRTPPALLFAMTLVSLLGPDRLTIGSPSGWCAGPGHPRLSRAELLRIRLLDHIGGSRAVGASDARLIRRVTVPGALPPPIVAATLAVGAVILGEAWPAFLGLGDPDTIRRGLTIGATGILVPQAWWTVTVPGRAVVVNVPCVRLVGDGLTDALDPNAHD